MQVIVDKLLTQYEQTGSGKSILLLHGWGDNLKSWLPLQKDLAKNFQVTALDLPGFGGTQAPAKVWGLDNYATFVAQFLKKINVATVDVIIAHSNGGALAVRGLAEELLSANKLILLASSGIRTEYRGKIKTIRMITKAGKALTIPLPKTTKQKLRQYVYKTVGSDMLVAEHLQETFKKVVTDDIQKDVPKIDIPVLLIYGENDTAAPVRYGQIFHELFPHSTLEIIGNAGHFVYQDQPETVAKFIKQFIS